MNVAIGTAPSMKPSSGATVTSMSNEKRVREGLDRARRVVDCAPLLAVIESIARERGLTAKQTELVAYSTTQVDRTELVTKLGVSTNTVKTRVRHLLRALDEKSLDSLGKRVLRRALESITGA